MSKYFLITGLIVSCSSAWAENSFENELRSNCAKVKSYAISGKKLYDQKQYKKALEVFKKQAMWSSFCEMNSEESGISFSEQLISTAYNNVGLSYVKLGQFDWARAWFSVFPEMKSSQFNLQNLPAATQSSNFAGEYVKHAGFGQWKTITVKRAHSVYDIKFNGLYMGARSLIYGPNIGTFNTQMPLKKAEASFHQDQCKINLKFGFNVQFGQHIQVNETNYTSCGFGHNVSAQGIYLKVN
jgi:tetratricopeptide (TPR) repeat protein